MERKAPSEGRAHESGNASGEAALLLSEIGYARARLTNSTRTADGKSQLLNALLDAIDSHARVRRLAQHLLDGDALAEVNRQLQELWTEIRAQSSDRQV